MPLLSGITGNEPLLGFVNDIQGFEKPTAAEALARVQQGMLPHQVAFCEDTEHRKLGLVCGFGAGKTYGLVCKSVHMAAMNVGHVSALFEPIAPMLRDILQRTMDELLEKWEIPFDFRVSPLPEYTLHFAEGSHTILLRTMETANRIRGQNLCAVGFDEADTANKNVATQAMRMALARLRDGNVQQFYAATTPEGFGWAYETFEKNASDDTALIRAKTSDNPYLPEGFIDSLLENYPEQLIKAYLDGVFVNLNTGQVYDRFDRAKHVITELPNVDNEPLRIGIDFNVTNTNAVIGCRLGNQLLLIDEISGAHDTDALAQEIQRRFPDRRIYVYPDASGGNRSTNASRTDIQILESYGFSNQSSRSNPAVRDRVLAVQGLLENSKGQVRVQISDKCKRLIECLELQSWNSKGEPDKEAGYDHLNDAFGYLVVREFSPLNARAGRGTGIRLY
nr:terminase large subunit [uncultured Mediterranean phage uvMED]